VRVRAIRGGTDGAALEASVCPPRARGDDRGAMGLTVTLWSQKTLVLRAALPLAMGFALSDLVRSLPGTMRVCVPGGSSGGGRWSYSVKGGARAPAEIVVRSPKQ